MSETLKDMIFENAGLVEEATLDAALRAALGETVTGVSRRKGALVVHHTDKADPLQIQSVVVNHLRDAPDLLIARAEERQTRQDALDAAWALLADAWDVTNSAGKFDALRVVLLSLRR